MKELNDDEVATFAAMRGVVALDFFATWCRPCTLLSPLFSKWEQTYTAVNFAKVNSDKCPKSVEVFNINYLPTIIIFKNGVETKRLVGIISENDFKDAI